MPQVSGQSWGQTTRTVRDIGVFTLAPPRVRSFYGRTGGSKGGHPATINLSLLFTTGEGVFMSILRICLGVLTAGLLGGLASAGPPKPPAEEKKTEPVGDRHYRVYDAKGNATTLDALLDRMSSVSVVFLGEYHDDPVAHHVQLLLLKKANERRLKELKSPRPLALAAEMFERDVQPVLNEYLAGLINEKSYLDSSRPWKNYAKDYKPLVEYAREQHLPVLASNAPRRYVNRVGRLGADSLKEIPDAFQRGLPPLPYGKASPAYKAKFDNLMKSMHKPPEKKPEEKKPDVKKTDVRKPEEKKPEVKKPGDKTPHPPAGQHNPGRGLEAQSLWDATMAYTLAEHLLRHPRAQIIHLNGSFHSEQRMGIPEHLLAYRPGTTVLVVTMIRDKSFPKFDVKEMADKGDFVIVTDPAMTPKPPKPEKGK
jgi:uncharacterized iron-regulated protein